MDRAPATLLVSSLRCFQVRFKVQVLIQSLALGNRTVLDPTVSLAVDTVY